MALLLIFSLMGIVIGAVIIHEGGWFIGGALGFLIAHAILAAQKIALLEQKIGVLKTLEKRVNDLTRVAPKTEDKADDQRPVPAASAPLISDSELEAIALKATPQDDLIEQRVDVIRDSKINEKLHETKTHHPQQTDNPQPKQPDLFEKSVDFIRRFFTEGNPIVRIGMVVMFFGLSFLVKYASTRGMFPIELRLAFVCAVAIALIAAGWKTRFKEGGYGWVLQGGGIAALYLTTFAAAKMYALMPTGIAFGLMFVIVILGVTLAVLQNAQVLAIMASAGGFLAPILTSDGSGNHIGLFSFYLLLNVGILLIAWFKAWRLLNWIGFVFTFVIASSWSVLKYEPHFYLSTQPFLLAFFALYLTVSILFSLRQPPNLKGLVDGSLVFGLPIVGFGLQTALLKHTDYGLAISSIILAAIYISLARILWNQYRQTHRILIESFIALAITFATLTIPLALNAQWTSATWALEAAGLIWVGLRQKRRLARAAGYLLYLAAAISLLVHGINAGAVPIISGDFIGLFILSVSAFIIAYLLLYFAESSALSEKTFAKILLNVGWFWWLLAGYAELNRHIDGLHVFPSLITFLALSVTSLLLLSQKIKWNELKLLGYWLLPLTGILVTINAIEAIFIGYKLHPTASWILIALVIFFVVNYRFLWRISDNKAQAPAGLMSAYHLLSAWFLVLLGIWEAVFWQDYYNWRGTHSAILWFVCFMIPLTALLFFTPKNSWPFSLYTSTYKNLIPAPLLLIMLIWFFSTSFHSGQTTQFYLPILNPLDLMQLGAIIMFAYSIKRNFMGIKEASTNIQYGLLGILGFVWINTITLRAIHNYAGIAYDADLMWNSSLVQMALSILWATSALVVMNFARRLNQRKLWILGASLLGLVLLKLFTKDLSGTGTLARILSFMVVGGLMLLIGYLSPIPSKTVATENDALKE